MKKNAAHIPTTLSKMFPFLSNVDIDAFLALCQYKKNSLIKLSLLKIGMMKIKLLTKLLLFVFSICWTSAFITAQNTVSGTVKAKGSKEVSIGANVVIKNTTIGSQTDADGKFTIKNAQAFPWTLVVSYTGYTTQEVVVNSATANLDISIAESTALIDEVVISASRKAEKVQEAPASVSVISAKTLGAASSAVDPIRELMNVPGVQIQQQSASRMNIEMRGGSLLFNTSVFPIMDYRSLIGPGLGTFNSIASGISSIDLQRIEVVRGPGSALYGPSVTSGVVHFISKNPIDNPGTSIELIGGQLKTLGATVRHAMVSKNKKVGFKINASYKKGDEFSLNPLDTSDAKQLKKLKTQIVNPIINDLGVVAASQTNAPVLLTKAQLDPDGDGNMMQADWWGASINGTLELRPVESTKIVLSGGFNQSSNVYYNSQGEGLSQGKEYWGQARFQRKGLFAQLFYVANDGGKADNPTFLYQTGNRTPVGRKQLEGQVQYNFVVEKFLNADFTVGTDYRSAESNTENMVYGRFEKDDAFVTYGAYAQGKFKIVPKLDLVLAGRYDKFNFLDDAAFSPRAALVFKATPTQTFRASYNNATSTPTALNIFIDFPVSTPAAGLFDVWLYGAKNGQTFSKTPMIDLTAPGMPNLPYGTTGLPLAIPYGAVTGNILTSLKAGLPADIYPLVESILKNPANTPKGLTGTLEGYNLFTGKPMTPVDAPKSRIQTQRTFEVGYVGKFMNKLTTTLDIYSIKSNGLVNFTAISPTIRFKNPSLATDLKNEVSGILIPQLKAALIAGGKSDAEATATANQIGGIVGGAYQSGGAAFSTQIAGLGPIFGAVETNEVPVDGMVHSAAGYRVFGVNKYWGADLGLSYLINDDFSVFFNYSMVNKVDFTAEDLGESADSGLTYSLNQPKNKYRMGAVYAPLLGWRGNVSFQHDDSFVAAFGQYSGATDVKNLIDAGVGYKLKNGLSLDLTCTNLFNQEYRAFVNMPKIGRRAIVKLTYTFGENK